MEYALYFWPMKKRIMIVGPTASGKSSLATALAETIGGEIISADSRQCYREIDKGTAKPSPEQLRRAPHHNISCMDLQEPDSAALFLERATTIASGIEERGNTVIYCGGSTLHLQSLIQPMDDLPPSNPAQVEKLNRAADEDGIEHLFEKLKEIDPDYASSMDGMNRQRIIRALDVYMQTGKPFSSFHKRGEVKPPSNLSVFLLHWPRKMLHERINSRAQAMIDNGLVEETRALLANGYSPDLQALKTVGYRQVIEYLNGEVNHAQMVKDIKTATRRYAKRQITWFRKWSFAHSIEMNEIDTAEALAFIQQQVAAVGDKG